MQHSNHWIPAIVFYTYYPFSTTFLFLTFFSYTEYGYRLKCSSARKQVPSMIQEMLSQETSSHYARHTAPNLQMFPLSTPDSVGVPNGSRAWTLSSPVPEQDLRFIPFPQRKLLRRTIPTCFTYQVCELFFLLHTRKWLVYRPHSPELRSCVHCSCSHSCSPSRTHSKSCLTTRY